MIKAVLFDLDGTLYNYDKVHRLSLKATHKAIRKHVSISYKEFIDLYKLSRSEIHRELAGTASAHNRILYFQRLIEKTHKTVEPGIILELYNAYWDATLDNITLFKDVSKILKTLKSREIKIAIVSNLTTNIQLRKLGKMGITKFVDKLVTSEEAGSEKPHAIMFLLALNKLGVSPHDAIMVGDDTIADIEGANFVGMKTVLLKSGKPSKLFEEDYRKPDYVIKDIGEFIPLLNRIRKD